MCGIAGFIDLKGNSTNEILLSMTTSLAHRGPDGEGLYFKQENQGQVGLGHRRLSIIDLSSVASQPMTYKHFQIVFNGEVYNYREIKAELIARGHSFITQSDTEVILHSYEEWGVSCVHRFIGMFALVIYDEEKKQLIAFRDRPGIKPFYYYHSNGLFLFASELKAFHQHPSFTRELDNNAVAAFLQYGNVPTPHCIFKNAAKLKPGHYLLFDISKNSLEIHQYWNVYDYYNRPKISIDFADALTETDKILKKAIEYRMVSDVPVGVFLSGGYDSTCVTALLQKDRTEKIKTYTIGFENKDLDETPFARDVADHLGTEHTEYTCSEKEARNIVSILPYYYDEPFADSSAIPTTLVSRLARKEVTVALSADAGDELFGGYARYSFILNFRNRLTKIPKPAARLGYWLMKAFPVHAIPFLKKNIHFANRYERFSEILRDPTLKTIYSFATQLFTHRELKDLLLNKFSLLSNDYRSNALKKEYFDPLTYMMAIDYQTYLLDDILQKVDRASMSIGLEAREPFLDHNVIEWASSLPVDFKYKDGQKKFIIKELVHKYVPQQIMDRPKMGFAIPVKEWMKVNFKEIVHYYLGDEFLSPQGIFDKKAARRLLTGFYSADKVPAEKLWYLLMFQMWYEKWMQGDR